MLKSLLLIALLTPAASKDPTFWWRTTDGAVVGTQQQCSLIIFNGTQAVIATWDRSSPGANVRLEDTSWHFANASVPVSLAISGMQLSGTAIGTGTYLTIQDRPIESIEPILAHASAVDANYRDDSGVHRFSFTIDQMKMPALLKAVVRCRKSP